MTIRLVHPRYSSTEGQAEKKIFFAPWPRVSFFTSFFGSSHNASVKKQHLITEIVQAKEAACTLGYCIFFLLMAG